MSLSPSERALMAAGSETGLWGAVPALNTSRDEQDWTLLLWGSGESRGVCPARPFGQEPYSLWIRLPQHHRSVPHLPGKSSVSDVQKGI